MSFKDRFQGKDYLTLMDWKKEEKQPPDTSDPTRIEEDKSEQIKQDPSLILE